MFATPRIEMHIMKIDFDFSSWNTYAHNYDVL